MAGQRYRAGFGGQLLTGRSGGTPPSRGLILAIVSAVGLLFGAALVAPMVIFASGSFSFESGTACSSAHGSGSQPGPSHDAKNSIPANYLALFKSAGAKYNVPWVILAGIGKVESDDGRTKLPGVHSGSNAFGAAGPMQIGIGGASGNSWGGRAIHPASEKVNGVAADGNGDGIASVYQPADAIAGAAKYLLAHGVLDNVSGAIFAYNHLQSYVQAVLLFAGRYAKGGFTVSPVTLDSATSCLTGVTKTPNALVRSIIAFAQQQLGKPYQWGATGPDAFDCSGLTEQAYRAAGIDIPRTSQQQWLWGPRIPASQVQPGDLVFFAGADGTTTSPGHVGLVIGGGKMIEAYATGFPIRVAPYGGRNPIGFTRPWAHKHISTAAAP
jgi:cell wall-associated NlpC family hydrolase